VFTHYSVALKIESENTVTRTAIIKMKAFLLIYLYLLHIFILKTFFILKTLKCLRSNLLLLFIQKKHNYHK